MVEIADLRERVSRPAALIAPLAAVAVLCAGAPAIARGIAAPASACRALPESLAAADPPKPLPPTPERPAPPKPTLHAGLEVWPAAHAIRLARKEKKPLVLVHGGAAPDAYWKRLDDAYLPGARRALAKMVIGEVPQPVPPAVIAILGGLDEKPLFAFGDFHGRVLVRFAGAPPTRGKFQRAARKVRARNAEIVQAEARVADLLAKSRYALKTKRTKESVRYYLATETVPLAPDSELVAERRSIRREMDAMIAKRREKAQKLEQKKDLASAIGEYEKIMQDFPLPDLKEELRKRVTDLWSRLRGYGG